ncbi:MAG TPA: SDR family oxidoreductase [Pseudomonadales bacterium]|nr:SDR family oxidoreductase [Pseudomonadales bacterium]
MSEKIMFLITGATGFLGGAIGVELIQQKRSDECLFLVRADSPAQALHRLRSNLRLFDVPEYLLERLTERNILLGDLGSADWHLDPRLNQVSCVINSAAVASFGKSPRIWTVNHDDTLRFAARLARVPHLKRFLHIGTGMACGIQAVPPVSETYEPGPAAKHLVPYTHSKAAVEAKMASLFPELPLVVARPSIIVGHSQLGCAPSSSIFWVFRMAKALGEFVCDFDAQVDVIPVDWAARAILLLAEKANLSWTRYHVSAGQDFSNTFKEIDQALSLALNESPMDYRPASYEKLFSRRKEFPRLFGAINPRMIPSAIKVYGAFSELNMLFDNSRLFSEGMTPPPRFSEYMDVCVQTTLDKSIADLMMIDFK